MYFILIHTHTYIIMYIMYSHMYFTPTIIIMMYIYHTYILHSYTYTHKGSASTIYKYYAEN